MRPSVSKILSVSDIPSFTLLASSTLSNLPIPVRQMEMRICHLQHKHPAFHLPDNLYELVRVQSHHQITIILLVGFVDDIELCDYN